jgi:hypothetical protein
MPLESATYLSQLVSTNPAHTDGLNAADSHMRLIKAALLATFPNFTAGALSSTQAALDAAASAVANGTFYASAGTAGAPSFSFTGDTDTGWYHSAANDMRASANGADVLKVSPAGVDVVGGASSFLLGGTSPFPIQTANIGNAQVTTAKIADANVTLAKLANAGGNNKLVAGLTSGAPYSELGIGSGLAVSSGNLVATSVPMPAAFKNLSIKVATNTTVACSADFVTMTDGSGNYRTAPASGTVDLGSNGAVNKLDTGTVAIDQWYYIWAISNGTTDGWLASLSATSPTMPSGYTYKARYGAVRTIHGSAILYGTWQLGRQARYILGLAQTAVLPVLISGTSGSPTVPTWTAASVSSFVPSTASAISLVLACIGSTLGAMAAPSNAYGAKGSNTIPAPLVIFGQNSAANMAYSLSGTFMLESTNVYYTSDSANGELFCVGWEDNI